MAEAAVPVGLWPGEDAELSGSGSAVDARAARDRHPEMPLSKPPLMTTDAVADGVTAGDGADSGPIPDGLPAVTVNVYVVPFASPVSVVLVCEGEPVVVVGVCATPLMYGVIEYVVAGPPVVGAVQDTSADLYPAVALTLVT